VDIEHCPKLRNMAKHEKWQKLDITPCYFDVTSCRSLMVTVAISRKKMGLPLHNQSWQLQYETLGPLWKKISKVTHPLSLTLIIEPDVERTTQSVFKHFALKMTVGGWKFPVALKHALTV